MNKYIVRYRLIKILKHQLLIGNCHIRQIINSDIMNIEFDLDGVEYIVTKTHKSDGFIFTIKDSENLYRVSIRKKQWYYILLYTDLKNIFNSERRTEING